MPESPFKRFGLPAGTVGGNPDRARVLSENKILRESGGAPMQDFGAVELRIPELDYYIIRERFPDLKSPDAEIRTRAWKKFLADPRSEIYKVR